MTHALPEHGRPSEDILQQLRGFGAMDPDYKHARLWSLVYWLDEPYADFLGQAYQAYASANGLNPGAFKSLKQFENQIIAPLPSCCTVGLRPAAWSPRAAPKAACWR